MIRKGGDFLSEIKGHIEVECGSERNFGVVFAIVFLIIALFPLLGEGAIRIWAIAVSGVFLSLALFLPNILSIPNKLWFKFGMLLGAIVAPIVMALVYFITVAPIGLLMRLTGKDILQQKLDKNIQSYWIERDKPVDTMKNQF